MWLLAVSGIGGVVIGVKGNLIYCGQLETFLLQKVKKLADWTSRSKSNKK
jgi:hypothetical protein